eukprot:TRINITY_DN16164_c0_g1_i1.p1 TRINITY_DN16164_c0_g1~~TRINITY_DN16164_c0_g1_i1.p1  ORF type:complete len:210 (-),score=34.83 TRINITY_DN16164_c0_g1_i1:123-752(-)
MVFGGTCVASAACIFNPSASAALVDVEREIDLSALDVSRVASGGSNAGGEGESQGAWRSVGNDFYLSPDGRGDEERDTDDGAYGADCVSVQDSEETDGIDQQGEAGGVNEVGEADGIGGDGGNATERPPRLRSQHVRFSEEVHVSSGSIRLLGSEGMDKYTLSATRRSSRSEHVSSSPRVSSHGAQERPKARHVVSLQDLAQSILLAPW